jgi:hypothetical protein
MDYECWRVNGAFEWSIQKCPGSDVSECFYFDAGDTCPMGKVIRI